jgi:diacylglycerol kinase (ATP)
VEPGFFATCRIILALFPAASVENIKFVPFWAFFWLALDLHLGMMRQMTQRRATIIYNPASGRPGKRTENAQEMARLLGERGIETETRATRAPEDATRLAGEAIESGATILVSYGGDGTLNEVIQAMAGREVVLAVWAGGTANVVARDLHLPKDGTRLAEVIAAGKTRRIALGLASTAQATRYFFMFAGIGLDASIARGVNARLKRRAGELAFWVSGVKHLIMAAAAFTVEIDGKKYDSGFTLIGNGKGYGGDVLMTKNALLDEAEFEVFIMPARKRNYAYVGSLVSCFRGKPERTLATIVKTDRVLATSEQEIWVELDGELAGRLPMTFEVVPDALSVIVP